MVAEWNGRQFSVGMRLASGKASGCMIGVKFVGDGLRQICGGSEGDC